MLFSIIVPVYNVEKYLKECIESLINQNSENYEILLIDDGSTDQSPTICDNYAAKYDNIRVFHKQNGGLSDARNNGIENAKGDYLIFVDSDDWIADNALSVFSDILSVNPVDVLITRLTEVYPGSVLQKDSEFEEYLKEPLTKERAVNWVMKRSQNTWPSVRFIISRRFVCGHNLRFPKGMLHEDIDWTAHICLFAETYCGTATEWYYHRMKRNGSITNSIKGKNIADTVCMTSDFFEDTKNDRSKQTDIICNRMMQSVYAKLNELKKCSAEDRDEVVRTVDEKRHIFSVAPKLRHKLFAIALKLLGPKNALKLLNHIRG
ncbi:MAG: glycosyltransferase family 2 protein [Clostridia bacterium]|nr:glycosyltransferase family 2 protein [Clostridia bacterium]